MAQLPLSRPWLLTGIEYRIILNLKDYGSSGFKDILAFKLSSDCPNIKLLEIEYWIIFPVRKFKNLYTPEQHHFTKHELIRNPQQPVSQAKDCGTMCAKVAFINEWYLRYYITQTFSCYGQSTSTSLGTIWTLLRHGPTWGLLVA